MNKHNHPEEILPKLPGILSSIMEDQTLMMKLSTVTVELHQ